MGRPKDEIQQLIDPKRNSYVFLGMPSVNTMNWTVEMIKDTLQCSRAEARKLHKKIYHLGNTAKARRFRHRMFEEDGATFSQWAQAHHVRSQRHVGGGPDHVGYVVEIRNAR